jgi:hypothetical protein
MVVNLWCYWAVWLPLVLGPFLRSTASWTLACTRPWLPLPGSWNLQQDNNLNHTLSFFFTAKTTFFNGHFNHRTCTPLKTCGLNWRGQSISASRICKDSVWRNGLKSLPMCSLNLIMFFRKRLDAVILARWGFEYWHSGTYLLEFVILDKHNLFLWAIALV